MTFYETLYKLMRENHLTSKQLSESLKIGKNQIKYWKDNGNIPSGDTLIALSDYFDVSIDYLLGRTDNPKTIYKNIQSSNVISCNNGNNSPLTVNGADQLDEIETELLKNFRQINFPDKLRVVSDVMKKAEGKK